MSPVTAFWPRSRRRLAARTVSLSLRCRSLEDTLARVTRERDAARAEARRMEESADCAARDADLWCQRAHALATRAEDNEACAWRLDPDEAHRLLHEQAAVLAAQQKEIDQLHATIARLRPVLMPRETP